MEETEMAELLIKMLETKSYEIESIVDALNTIDRDYLWDVDDSELNGSIDILHDAVKSAKKELRRRK